MDSFDTPTMIPERKQKPQGRTMNERLTAAGETIGRGLDLAGKPLAAPAVHWFKAAGERSDKRTEDARKALLEANRNHRDAMRDLRRDRKAFEKARDEVAWWNVFNGERRAARIVVRDTKELATEARNIRREAKRAFPLSLPQLARRCHAVHAGATGLWWLMSDSVASDVAAGTSVAAIAFNVATVWLGGRHVSRDTVDAELEALLPSQEERDLLQRLDPKVWHSVAEPRGLSDVVAGRATLTNAGIQVKLTLNGSMDLTTLQKKEAQLRAALRLREGTRLELREGKTGGHARLTLRTRSTADGLDLTGWKPGDAWAVNTITGEVVPVPLGKRILFAGTSGAGKSWSARPLMAEASEHEDHRLVIFDRKHIEARNWEHRARTATELDEMRDLCNELIAEGEDRLKLIPRGQDVVTISPSRPRITVFVDEGGELISDSKTKYPKDEDGMSDYQDIMTSMRTIARKYRAAEIILVWCTQKPALSGDGHGLDSQIAGQLVHRLSLALATTTDAQVVFGNDAIEKGWKANELPMPGFALFRNQELGPKSIPQIMKMRAMSPADVIALPPRPIWSRSTGRASVADVAARKVIEADGRALAATTLVDPWAGTDVDTDTVPLLDPPKTRVSAEDRDDQIIGILTADPCQTLSELARLTGASKSVVKRRLDQMEVDGLVVRDEENCWHVIQ